MRTAIDPIPQRMRRRVERSTAVATTQMLAATAVADAAWPDGQAHPLNIDEARLAGGRGRATIRLAICTMACVSTRARSGRAAVPLRWVRRHSHTPTPAVHATSTGADPARLTAAAARVIHVVRWSAIQRAIRISHPRLVVTPSWLRTMTPTTTVIHSSTAKPANIWYQPSRSRRSSAHGALDASRNETIGVSLSWS